MIINIQIEELKKDILKDKKVLFDELKKQGEFYQKMKLSKTPPPESTTYMGMAIFNLSILFLLTENKTYLEEAKRFIKTVLDYEVWGHAYLVNVDLSASWILFGLSLGYRYLYPYLTEEENQQIGEKLYKHGTIMYEYRQNTYGKGWSTRYYQNHNWINMTGLYTAGYILKDIYDTKAWLDDALSNFKRVFSLLTDDGSNYEGTSYWHYGVMWLLVAADVIKETTNKDYFKESLFLQNTFDFKMSQTLPDLKQAIIFGDTHDTRSSHSVAMYYKFASEYNNPYAQAMGDKVLTFYDEEQSLSHIKPGLKAQIGLALLWYNPKVKRESISEYKRYQYYPDLGMISLKSFGKNNSYMFSAKCSNPGGNKQFEKLFELKEKGIDAFGLSHHHPDNGHFVLIKNNEYLVTDDGYNRNLFLSDHNVVTPQNYGCDVEDVTDVYTQSIKARKDKGEMTFGSVIYQNYVDNNILFYHCENAGTFALAANIINSQRLFVIPHFDYVIILDVIESSDAHKYNFNLHLEEKPEITKYGFKNKDLCIYNVLPRIGKKEIKEKFIKTIYTTQEPDIFKEKTMFNAIYQSKEVNKQVFLTVLSFEELDVVYKEDELFIKNGKFIDSFIFDSEEFVFRFIQKRLANEQIYVYDKEIYKR